MIKLNNNFTTQEQSKLLLELGVPADSADCYYRNWDCLLEHPSTDTSKYIHIRKTQIEREACYMHFAGNLPCWSVGRLIEILFKCSDGSSELTLISERYSTDYIIKVLEGAIKYSRVDLTKLNS